MAKKRKKATVWVVMHYECMFHEQIDSVQFHVSSTLRKAEKYIAERGVMPYSWWQIHPHLVDHDDWKDSDEGVEVHYYSHTGKPLKQPPYKRALAAYRHHLECERRTNGAPRKSKKDRRSP